MTTAILLVEDDDNDVILLRHAFKKAGIINPVRVASDGQQAIDYFKSATRVGSNGEFPLPCLVLLDLKLPYVMGLDVLRWIRKERGTALPVIMLTASAEEEDIASAYSLGANGFLSKPSEASKLEGIVRAIRDFWLTHNTLPQKCLADSPMERMVGLTSLRSLGNRLIGTNREGSSCNTEANL